MQSFICNEQQKTESHLRFRDVRVKLGESCQKKTISISLQNENEKKRFYNNLIIKFFIFQFMKHGVHNFLGVEK